MFYLTDKNGRPVGATSPLQVLDVNAAHENEAIAAEAVTFITGAASFTGAVALDKGPVANLTGDKVGSYWRIPANLAIASGGRPTGGLDARAISIVKTALSATITLNDPYYNLEQLFETPSGSSAKAVVLLRDPGGNELYGWVGPVSSTNAYTLDVYNGPVIGTAAKSWVGSTSNFTFATGTTFEIYFNESSFSWTTGTVLTQEVEYKRGTPEADQMKALAAGDFAINYETGRIIYKKATTGTSDSANYNVLKPYETATISGTVTVTGGDSTNGLTAVAIKPVAASTYSPTKFTNFGANATLNVKASAGNVFSLFCDNRNAATRYIQLHSTATVPGGGAVPLYTFPVFGNSFLALGTDFFTAQGVNITTGIAFAFSTTEHTYTAGTAGEQTTTILYI